MADCFCLSWIIDLSKMISKTLLDDVVAWEHCYYSPRHGEAFDRYTLHFKQWWRPNMKLEPMRILDDVDEETGMFTHHMSNQSSALYDRLIDHIAKTFDEVYNEVQAPERCPVLQLVPNKIEEEVKE